MTLTVPVETALPVSVAVISSTNGVDVYGIDLAVVITPVSGTIAKSEFVSPPESKFMLHYVDIFFLSFFPFFFLYSFLLSSNKCVFTNSQ